MVLFQPVKSPKKTVYKRRILFMAKSAISLSAEEASYFHKNYLYMWKKLNTLPYYVSGFGEIPTWIKNEDALPSYVNLSKCMNNDFTPSMNLVNKIVTFYNSNIAPQIDTYQFLHERLEDTDSARSTLTDTNAKNFSGLYYGYYYAGLADAKMIYGAILNIFDDGNNISARLITGLTADEDLFSKELKDLITSEDLTLEEYTKYRNSLSLAKRRTALYSGEVKCSPGILTMNTRCIDHEGSALVFRLITDGGSEDEFLGTLGLISLITKDFGFQLLKMGIMKADHPELRPLSLSNEKLLNILKLQKEENEHVRMNFTEIRGWTDLMLSNCE